MKPFRLRPKFVPYYGTNFTTVLSSVVRSADSAGGGRSFHRVAFVPHYGTNFTTVLSSVVRSADSAGGGRSFHRVAFVPHYGTNFTAVLSSVARIHGPKPIALHNRSPHPRAKSYGVLRTTLGVRNPAGAGLRFASPLFGKSWSMAPALHSGWTQLLPGAEHLASPQPFRVVAGP